MSAKLDRTGERSILRANRPARVSISRANRSAPGRDLGDVGIEGGNHPDRGPSIIVTSRQGGVRRPANSRPDVAAAMIAISAVTIQVFEIAGHRLVKTVRPSCEMPGWDNGSEPMAMNHLLGAVNLLDALPLAHRQPLGAIEADPLRAGSWWPAALQGFFG